MDKRGRELTGVAIGSRASPWGWLTGLHLKGVAMDQRVFSADRKSPAGSITAKTPKYDVSIILNLHNEARYLKRTMLSLEEAVRYARQFDITFEIVVVLDNADKATTALAEAYDYSVFDAVQVIRVRNGSLGLSRNDGIRVSHGEYIATADADDLVAFDYFHKIFWTAVHSGGRSIVFPEYYIGFGSKHYVWKFWSHEYIGNAAFYDGHPYVSRVIFHRDLFTNVKFADASVKSGYAYEDWHFNCECIAAGYPIEVAKNAVLFYRQRPGSLLQRANSETSRLTPRSRFFEPETFAKLAWVEFVAPDRQKMSCTPFKTDQFMSLPGVADILAAANRIDPAISMGILQHKEASTNFAAPGPAARAYFEVCQQIAGDSFTDILLVPFFAKGGAEKYILSVVGALRELRPETKLLVVATQKFGNHECLERLPEGSLFLDLQTLGVPGLTDQAIETITFRLIQHLPGVVRVHMKNCEFVDLFARKFAPLLKDIDTIFYHFCDPAVTIDQVSFVNGQSFDLVSEAGYNFSHIISDHGRNVGLIESMIGCEVAGKSHTLYAECSLPANKSRTGRRPTKKLLWASRIDGQKRPELLTGIAHLLEKGGLDVSLDAYGGTTYGRIGPEVFDGAARLTYKGAFDSFDELRVADYDGFLYTAAFDGLPNVVLEALAAGLPVIAPDVGGIGEAVTGQTGFLVEDDTDPDRLAERFVEAIKELYDDWPEAVRRGENGRGLIAERHSREAFVKRVAEVFALEQRGSRSKPQRKSFRKTGAS